MLPHLGHSTHPRLKTLTTALKAAKLNTVLQGTGTFTVFAPVDEAFLTGNMQSYKLKYLLDPENMDSLKTLLTYHVLPESRTTNELTNDETLKTVDGQNLFVEKNATSLVIHDITCAKAEILDKDLMATNGVVQVVSEAFVPEGVFCPDVIFAAEQREQARISYYGYDCRKKATKHLTDQEATKPVGLTVDQNTQQVFWSNDEDYPHGAATSWLSKATFDGTINTHFREQKLYFTQHYGNTINKCNYDGSNIETIVSKPGNISFQPSDVAVDSNAGRIFVSVEGNEDIYGALLSYKLDGTDEQILKTNLNRPYGLCVDDIKSHVYYVQGGHGGSISCLAYGKTPCVREVFADILEYPYMCAVDNSLSKYGAPTTLVFSQANLPGQIYYITDLPNSTKTKLNVVTDDLQAPMGVEFGCVGKGKSKFSEN
eukprot:g2089.t1